MTLHGFLDRPQYVRKILVPVEEDDCDFRVPPAAIAEKLVHSLEKLLRPAAVLALRNKDVAAFRSDKNVGLALIVEGLASGLPLIMTVELNQEMRAQGLLVHGDEGRRTSLHHLRHVLNDLEDVFVVRVREHGLRLEG